MNWIPRRHTPRWIIFFIDILISLASLFIAYLMRFDFLSEPYESELPHLKDALPFYILIRAASFWIGKTYTGIVRYTGTQDTKRIFLTVLAGSVMFMIINPFKYNYDGYYLLPTTIIILDFMTCVFLLITTRIAIKLMFLEGQRARDKQLNVVIYGAGQAGLITKRTLDREANRKQQVVAFFDDDKTKKGKAIEGARIYATDQLENFLKSGKADQLIVSIQTPDPERKNTVLDTCLKYGVEAMSVPPVSTWINEELNVSQLQKVKIEDLLGRKPIRISHEKLEGDIAGKRILVTGAAGSIGSGLVRQIVRFDPAQLILIDQAESPLYDIEQELAQSGYQSKIQTIVADITDKRRMENILSAIQVDQIFHAAAYKHVPLMEANVYEAIKTNVLGTRNLVDLSTQYKIKKFVMISTDKAVNPTSVMGASKRLAEMYAQSCEGQATAFITTRFGNVLGSNGSVIPLFKKQIENGGPLTLTHPDVTRFFMTIPEACQLVLEAGSMGGGGEIYIFDMGKSVKIKDLAEKMIKLSGLKPYEDIDIQVTGLRPGEKLYEELLANEENTLKTHHPQIMKARMRIYDKEGVAEGISEIIDRALSGEILRSVELMKELIPEYISNNSEFAKFDFEKE